MKIWKSPVCYYYCATAWQIQQNDMCTKRRLIWVKSHWAATWQNQQSECAPSEDSDQPGHPPSLIRVFTVRTKKAWVLSYPLSAQRRLWSDWADAQADLSLRWAHSHIVGFVTSWLNLGSCFPAYTYTCIKTYIHKWEFRKVGLDQYSIILIFSDSEWVGCIFVPKQ